MEERGYELTEEGNEAFSVEVESFIQDNAEEFDSSDVASIHALNPGEEVRFGGGAAPLFTLKRVR